MAIKIFIGVVIFLVACGLAFLAYVGFTNKKKFTGVVATLLALVAVVALCIVPASIHQVNEGEVAVVKEFGKAIDTRNPGIHFDLCVTRSYQYYDAKVQSIEMDSPTYSSDAQLIDLAISFQYKIMPDKLLNIIAEYGSIEALNTRISKVVLDKTKSVFSSYTAMNIIAERSSMSERVEEVLRSAIDESYYITVTEVAVSNIDFSDVFEKAVEEKMVAEQTKLKAQYEAEATLVAAEAEAKANQIISNSITDELLKMEEIEARKKHGWITVNGADAVVVDTTNEE